MVAHSSVLAWRIPGTGEPGGLPSMGLHRVDHDWGDLAAAAAAAAASFCVEISILIDSYWYRYKYRYTWDFPGGAVIRNMPANEADSGSTPELGRFPGGGDGKSLQYSCLENPMDKEAWWATVCGVAKSQIWLSDWAPTHPPTHTHTHSHSHTGLSMYVLFGYLHILISFHEFSEWTLGVSDGQGGLACCDSWGCKE